MLRPQVTVRWTAVQQADVPPDTWFQSCDWLPIIVEGSTLCCVTDHRLRSGYFKEHINRYG